MSDSSKSIVKLLGEGKEEDKYYVYALCDPDTHVPFYIGKGEHFRVWAHEEGEEKERATILGAFQNHEITEDEKEERLKTLSVKHKTINAIRCRSGKQPEKVIIKWGLTSHEAFMAESALINLFQLMQQNSNSLSLDIFHSLSPFSSVKVNNLKDFIACTVADIAIFLVIAVDHGCRAVCQL